MMGKQFVVFGKTIRIQFLDRPGNAAVDLLTPLFEKTLVSYLLGENIFEDVLQLRVEGFFI
jgi:hypothetical protein